MGVAIEAIFEFVDLVGKVVSLSIPMFEVEEAIAMATTAAAEAAILIFILN
jgi:hypothetical protein